MDGANYWIFSRSFYFGDDVIKFEDTKFLVGIKPDTAEVNGLTFNFGLFEFCGVIY